MRKVLESPRNTVKRRQRNTRDLARETDVSGVKIHGGTAENDSVVVTDVR